MVKLLVLSDTHIPTRARDLPDALWQEIDQADIIFHAGDWVDTATLDSVAERASQLVAVYGNNDSAEIRRRLPRVARINVDGVEIALVHETGTAGGRERRMDDAYTGINVLFFGHSHIPWDSRTAGGIRLLNPGSPTDRRRQPAGTFMTADVIDSSLKNVQVVALPSRSRTT